MFPSPVLFHHEVLLAASYKRHHRRHHHFTVTSQYGDSHIILLGQGIW